MEPRAGEDHPYAASVQSFVCGSDGPFGLRSGFTGLVVETLAAEPGGNRECSSGTGDEPGESGVENEEVKPSSPVGRRDAFSPKSNAVKLAARREALLVAANRKATHEEKAIASWKSPTVTLLDSSSGELLKSLPQLNQTVDELKSFLPSQPK